MTETISTDDFQQLSAYVDGELHGVQRQQLEARLAAEPALAATLAALREQQAQLRAPFQGAGEAVPAHVRALLEKGNNVVSLPTRRGGYWQGRPLHRLAVAASLLAAVGLLALPRWQAGSDSEALLSLALETLPSRATGWHELEDGQRIRPMLSFPHQNGQWCREYLLDAGDAHTHGIACREAGAHQWQTTFSVAWEPSDESNAYRPASAHDHRDVAAWIDAHAADIALGASQEAELIANQWQ
ncbi:hypothetical protein [Haliea atlantica]|jgi:hypothetical protein|nr:hypothetical protein [Haliea sp.]|tara:strand:- start:21159 stop:21887 length:729 start_codon:yes stop_codon:yes gene_type:complete